MNKLAHLAINDEGFVFDPTSGDSFQVSQTGLIILSALRAGKSDEETAQSLADNYEVSLENAQRDLADFRANLKNLSLI
jgi:hypothetical protein